MGARRVPYDHRTAAEFVVKTFALQISRAMSDLHSKAAEDVMRAQTVVLNGLKIVEGVSGDLRKTMPFVTQAGLRHRIGTMVEFTK